MIRITDPEWEAEAKKAVEAVIELYEMGSDMARSGIHCPACKKFEAGYMACWNCPIYLFTKTYCMDQIDYVKFDGPSRYSDLTPAQRTARIAHLRKVIAAIPELKRKYGGKGK